MDNSGIAAQAPADARVEPLRKELGPFALAAETTQMAMIFTDGQDAENPIVFANDAFLSLTGFSRADILGAPLTFLLAEVTDPSTASSIGSVITRGGSGRWEVPCQRADKSEFLAAMFLSPVRDAQETVRQNILSFVEFGGPVERLMSQRSEFHALYERAPGFIATAQGPEHRFTFANASYCRFVGRDTLEGLTVAEALPEIVSQGFIDLLDQVYHTGEPFVGTSMPISIVNPATGLVETRYADFVYQAIRDANGTVTGLFCEGYEVTAQRETADALAALQSELIHVSRVNAMGTMATTLAHELNQPLSAITNYTAGMLRRIDPAAPDANAIIQGLQGIEEASQRAAEIIRNLRELTRRRATARIPFALKPAIAECVRLVRATASPSVQIIEQIPDGMTIAADRVQTQQVVINLLRNACDAVMASDRRRVSIVAKEIDERLVVSVLDTGRGVPIEAAQNIFAWSDSTKEGGMGLGLSICRTIIEAHQGSIWLQNSGPDGSEFCFAVPRTSGPAPSGDGVVLSTIGAAGEPLPA